MSCKGLNSLLGIPPAMGEIAEFGGFGGVGDGS